MSRFALNHHIDVVLFTHKREAFGDHCCFGQVVRHTS